MRWSNFIQKKIFLLRLSAKIVGSDVCRKCHLRISLKWKVTIKSVELFRKIAQTDIHTKGNENFHHEYRVHFYIHLIKSWSTSHRHFNKQLIWLKTRFVPRFSHSCHFYYYLYSQNEDKNQQTLPKFRRVLFCKYLIHLNLLSRFVVLIEVTRVPHNTRTYARKTYTDIIYPHR